MSKHQERHYANRIGWLRAAVLGANDGIVSTASLVGWLSVAFAEGAVGSRSLPGAWYASALNLELWRLD